jgi:hypothetical protein
MKRLAIVTCAAALGVFTTATMANAAPPEAGKEALRGPGRRFVQRPGHEDLHHGLAVCQGGQGNRQSERGNGDVTTTSDVQVLSRVIVKDDCLFVTGDTTESWPISTCDQYGVYPPN